MFRRQKLGVFFLGNDFDNMNNAEFLSLEMIPPSRFKKFSKHNGERRGKCGIYPQEG